MSIRSIAIRVKHAIFGAPLTHEQQQAKNAAERASGRVSNAAANEARARSVQNQGFHF
ncbi:hypothetical protein [Microbacterium sp. NPDC076911]|uniref:hypothetical protein n=1 Tax=Microbacterium sp. NPDC076911 TaxID=3154958 RepID=UPI00342D5DF5